MKIKEARKEIEDLNKFFDEYKLTGDSTKIRNFIKKHDLVDEKEKIELWKLAFRFASKYDLHLQSDKSWKFKITGRAKLIGKDKTDKESLQELEAVKTIFNMKAEKILDSNIENPKTNKVEYLKRSLIDKKGIEVFKLEFAKTIKGINIEKILFIQEIIDKTDYSEREPWFTFEQGKRRAIIIIQNN